MRTIIFKDKSTNKTVSREGIKVGEYLAVTEQAEIFKVNTGRKLLISSFKDYWEAKKFAQWLEERYRRYFVLWERWPNINIFNLARWSIPEGKLVLDIIDKVESGEITAFSDVERLL